MAKPEILEEGYSEFSERFHTQSSKHRIPTDGAFEVTFRCNLRCRHCYVVQEEEAELSTQEIYRILDEIAEAGCLWLLITGGEPLTRKDFQDIYLYAKRKGFLITLFTNGTLITPEITNFLIKWPPFTLEITLYGITQETYERFTDVPGSFKRCMKGIKLLTEKKIPLKLKTMVTTLNKDELWNIKEFAESLGADFRFDPHISPRIDGSKEPCKLRIPAEEVVELDLIDGRRSEEWKEFCQKYWGKVNADFLYNCGGGISSFSIDPYGRLSICEASRTPSYDLRRGSFKQGWSEFLTNLRQQKVVRNTKCRSCDLISLCGQCPGWAQLENGDPESPVEYLCQIAELRAEVFKTDLSEASTLNKGGE
ncbi:MAG: radical SAM protein [Candidatus Aminicenantes bacterium]|nr:radical SAM protein [Candidatus Aminicenantes bacterium]